MSTHRPTDDSVDGHSTCADRIALDQIASILRAPEWEGADCLEAIGAIVMGTDRSLDHTDACHGCGLGGWYGNGCSAPEFGEEYDHSRAKEDARNAVMDAADGDAPIRYRVKYEDHNDDELGSHDAFASRCTAFAHFRSVIAEPFAGLASVYVTDDDGSAEHVIATHRFSGAGAA